MSNNPGGLSSLSTWFACLFWPLALRFHTGCRGKCHDQTRSGDSSRALIVLFFAAFSVPADLCGEDPKTETHSLNVESIAPKGKWHSAEVPVTLDLAKRARLAVNALTGNVDPNNRYLVFQSFSFGQHPAKATSPSGLHAKNARALPWMRAMCGSRQNLDIEVGMIKELTPAANTLMLENWYERDQNPFWLDRIKQLSRNLNPNAPHIVHVADRAFIPPESALHPDGTWRFIGGNAAIPYRPPAEPIADQQGSEGCVKWHQMWMMKDLVRYHRYTDSEDALKLLRQFTRFCMKPDLWEDTGRDGAAGHEHGIWGGHWHGNMGAVQALLEVAMLEDDDRLKQIVREAYDHGVRQGVVRLGFFPAWLNPEKYKRGGNLAEVCESCGIADTLILAVKLTDAGVGDYWDDVDSIVRNQLIEQQFVDVEQMTRTAGGDPSSDALIRRFVGGFGVGGLTGIKPESYGCCTANGSMALYYAWHGITRFDRGVATVNMFLNRSSPWLDVDSYLPYEGKVVLRNKRAHTVLVRVPVWVEQDEVDCFVNAKAVKANRTGRYLLFRDCRPDDEVRLQFPITERTGTYTIHGKPFRVTFRGSTVVDVQPSKTDAGHYALYQREHMRESMAPLRTVKRFVADRIIPLQ